MNGLGTALPDRDGGGKKKPEDDGDDAADPDVRFAAFPRVSSPLPRRSSLARSRASPRDAPRAISPSRARAVGSNAPLRDLFAPRSLAVPPPPPPAPLAHPPPPPRSPPQFAAGVNQADVMKALGQLGGNAGLIGALQHKLDGLVGMSSGFVESLPWKVRARVAKLSELQETHDEFYEAYLEELAALKAKYQEKYAPLYAERAAIVKGEQDVAAEPKEGDDADEKQPEGVPDFWLCALRNHEMLGERITEKDEVALKHLVDVTCKPLEKEPDDDEEEEEEEPKGFTLEFHFEENPFFTNAVLTKTYHMVDEEDPILEFAEGTEIDWHPGKNLCVKVMRKKPKKGAKNHKPQTKTEKAESFFNFFSPPEVPGEDDEVEMTAEEAEELQEAMEEDYEMGAIIKEKIIPDAVSWFTGEANEDSDEDDSDFDEEEEDDEDDEDESVVDEDDENGAKTEDGEEKPPECKQQ